MAGVTELLGLAGEGRFSITSRSDPNAPLAKSSMQFACVFGSATTFTAVASNPVPASATVATILAFLGNARQMCRAVALWTTFSCTSSPASSGASRAIGGLRSRTVVSQDGGTWTKDLFAVEYIIGAVIGTQQCGCNKIALPVRHAFCSNRR